MSPERKTDEPSNEREKITGDGSPTETTNGWPIFGICIFLAAIVWAVFGQTTGFDFVNFDDSQYVTENAAVTAGLTMHGVATAFSSVGTDNWIPLTTLSHMLDCQWYGLRAGGHHLTNVLLHALTVILLFLTLHRMTGVRWRSAFVAAVFAIHPLRAESVAWVTERKDVLCGVFFMLTLWCYAGYVRKTGNGKGHTKWMSYAAALFFTGCALLSKPMAVTLPFVLLLLDYWPLQRFFRLERNGSVLQLLAEKVPFLALCIAICLATILLQKHVIKAAGDIPVWLRTENVIVSYAVYIRQLFFPAGLAPYYNFRIGGLPGSQIIVSAVLLTVASWATCHWRKKYPYLPVGWLWYLVVFLPVIGFVQVGPQAHADRYTYLPEIGLCLMLTWLVADLIGRMPLRLVVLGSSATVILAALIYCGHRQVSYWRNSGTLWAHAVDCDPHDARAHNDLGAYYYDEKQWDNAIAQFKEAVKNNSKLMLAYNYLGQAYSEKGDADDAIPQYQEAIELDPGYAIAHYNLGIAFAKKGLMDQAIAEYQKALASDPVADARNYSTPTSQEVVSMTMTRDYSLFHNALGLALAWEGRMEEAIVQYREALELNPHFEDASNNLASALLKKNQPMDARTHNNLGTILRREGRLDDAIIEYQQAIKIDPLYAPAHFNLGNALVQKGDVNDAIVEYQAALKIKPDNAMVQKYLAHTVWMLATSPDVSVRNGTNAVAFAQTANKLADGNNPFILRALAAADAECGNFPAAIEIANRGIALAAEQQNRPLKDALGQDVSQYRAGAPIRADPMNMDGW
jgi:tetratricopeptide (TPR) repeat protein